MNLVAAHPLLLAYLGKVHLLVGRVDDARQHAEQAVGLARTHKESGYEAWALRLHADIALGSGCPDAARAADYARKALMKAEELGLRPLMAHCHRALGRALAQGTDPAAAERHVAAANQLFSVMDMRAWLGQALERLA